MTKEQICSQVPHCLSCPISIAVTNRDCRSLSGKEIDYYVNAWEGKIMYKVVFKHEDIPMLTLNRYMLSFAIDTAYFHKNYISCSAIEIYKGNTLICVINN